MYFGKTVNRFADFSDNKGLYCFFVLTNYSKYDIIDLIMGMYARNQTVR